MSVVKIERKLATDLWQLAIEAAPNSASGLILRREEEFVLFPLAQANQSWPDCHTLESIQTLFDTSVIWGLYQSFDTEVSSPPIDRWTVLPNQTVLMAVDLRTKGVLDIQPFVFDGAAVQNQSLELSV